MKRSLQVIAASFLALLNQLALAQGIFQNLNFEGTTIPQTQPPGNVSSLDALPFWTVYTGTNQLSQVFFNEIALGSTYVDLLGTNGSLGARAIQGGYSVLLQGGGTATDASIRQTGTVPTGSQTIYFAAQTGGGSLIVSLGGSALSYVAVSNGPNFVEYGADISAYAGQTLELEFSAPRYSFDNDWNIDSIRFSTSQIPEPTIFGLFGLGALLLNYRFLRRRR